MSDIRKRVGKKGTTYQVRYPSKGTKSGYAYKSFDTRKEAVAFVESGKTRSHNGVTDSSIKSVQQAIEKWLQICEKEGTDNQDPVTTYTLSTYEYRAEFMKAYDWTAELQELTTPDIVEFRSWLLENCVSRDQARKVLSSFHTVLKEMALRGIVANNPAAGVSIRMDSRYKQPIEPPTEKEIVSLLSAADRLANSKNKRIADAWERYRPILYMATDTGLRPQEYLVVPRENLNPKTVKVDRAIEKGGYKISVTKTPAGWRWVDVTPESRDMALHYADNNDDLPDDCSLLFPTATGGILGVDNWRNRGFRLACESAGLMKKVKQDGQMVEKPKLKPYDLRHFYASMLIDQGTNLKRIQALMGHTDIKTTLNTYGHLIERAESKKEDRTGMLASLSRKPCGKSVARTN